MCSVFLPSYKDNTVTRYKAQKITGKKIPHPQHIILSPEVVGSTWITILQICDVNYLAKDYLATVMSMLRFNILSSGSMAQSCEQN